VNFLVVFKEANATIDHGIQFPSSHWWYASRGADHYHQWNDEKFFSGISGMRLAAAQDRETPSSRTRGRKRTEIGAYRDA
jgi:hypothetical protein